MSEYISKEDISRVLSERIGANESCLSNARELGNHEGEQYFHNLVFEDEQITSLIEELHTYSFPDREKGIFTARIKEKGEEETTYLCRKIDMGQTHFILIDNENYVIGMFPKDVERAVIESANREKGEWIDHECDSEFYRCSKCHICWTKGEVDNCNMNFCPNCGADMRESIGEKGE